MTNRLKRALVITQGQVQALRRQGISLTGDVVSIEDLARSHGVSDESVEVRARARDHRRKPKLDCSNCSKIRLIQQADQIQRH